MASSGLQSRLGEVRRRAGLTQAQLAERVGASRQALLALEAGRSVPATALALRLARALGCRVEDLFALADEEPAPPAVEAHLAGPAAAGGRVAVGRVGRRWVAHPLSGEAALAPADGLVAAGARAGRARVELLAPPEQLADALLVAGCAPGLGLLARHAAERGRAPLGLRWVEASSGRALEALARGAAHVAGLHLRDGATGDFNVPIVRRRLAGRALVVVTLARWTAGLVVAKGNPKGVGGAADLARRGLTVARREPGSGAGALLDAALAAAGVPRARLAPGPLAHGHLEVARLVALGLADAGVSLESAAQALGLDFVPLAEERFDLVLPRALAEEPRGGRLLDALGSRAFKRDLGSLGGHEARDAGAVVAELR